MMKKQINLQVILKIVMLTICAICIISNFNSVRADAVDEIINQGQSFIQGGQDQVNSTMPDLETTIFDKLKVLGQVLVSIATGVIIVVGLVMAIKWIVAKPDEQAKLKQQLVGLVISVIVIYGAVGIWTVVRNILTSLNI